jgi:hypothetical protein
MDFTPLRLLAFGALHFCFCFILRFYIRFLRMDILLAAEAMGDGWCLVRYRRARDD